MSAAFSIVADLHCPGKGTHQGTGAGKDAIGNSLADRTSVSDPQSFPKSSGFEMKAMGSPQPVFEILPMLHRLGKTIVGGGVSVTTQLKTEGSPLLHAPQHPLAATIKVACV